MLQEFGSNTAWDLINMFVFEYHILNGDSTVYFHSSA